MYLLIVLHYLNLKTYTINIKEVRMNLFKFKALFS